MSARLAGGIRSGSTSVSIPSLLRDDTGPTTVGVGRYEVVHADCLDAMSLIPDGSVDLVLCDLPYGTTWCKWDTVIPLDALWSHYRRVIKPRGAVVLTASQPFTTTLITSNPKWFRFAMVWEKSRATGFLDSKRRPLKSHEDVLVFAASMPTYNPQTTPAPLRTGWRNGSKTPIYGSSDGRHYNNHGKAYPKTVMRFASERGFHHTQKPVALMEYLARTFSNPGETVLDNAMGSGTTGVACLQSGRSFIGIERDPRYFEIAAKRLRDANAAASETLFHGFKRLEPTPE